MLCVPLTSNLVWADAPGNVLLPASTTALTKDSVANVSQLLALDKTTLTDRLSKLSRAKVEFFGSLNCGASGEAALEERKTGLVQLENSRRPHRPSS